VKLVHKYALPLPHPSSESPVVTVEMPAGALPLHAGVQHDTPKVWALVDPRAPVRSCRLLVVGDEWNIGPDWDWDGWVHVGTFFLASNRLVFHVFREVVLLGCRRIVAIDASGRHYCTLPELHDGHCRTSGEKRTA